MQVDGMLDKIGIIHWMSSNTPILWITLLDKLYNIVTGNWLQRKSMLQVQFVGERMKAQCISNFTDGFKVSTIIWNFVNSLDVMLTVELAWQMELVPIFQYKSVPPITYWWIWMPLQEVNISIGTQIRSGSRMINTHWHAKMRCPTVIQLHDITSWKNLNWSTCLNQGNVTKMPTEFLYLSSVKNALPRTTKEPVVQKWGPLAKISKCTQLLQLRWAVIKKNKNKWELSALE